MDLGPGWKLNLGPSPDPDLFLNKSPKGFLDTSKFAKDCVKTVGRFLKCACLGSEFY